ncbi:MAG: tetratricopeptide repeat protein [Planctomycetes bacterium]|nr:tetratricopeptide repeat protein [Planctomycetota bacterium]
MALLLALASSGVWIPHAGAQDAAKTKDEDETCKEIYDRTVELNARIPSDFRDVSAAVAQEIGEAVESATQECVRFLKLCPEAAKAPEMHFYLAKFLSLLSRRFEHAQRAAILEGDQRASDAQVRRLQEALAKYHGTIAAEAAAAYETLPDSSELRPEALYMCGRGQFDAQDFAAARTSFEKLIARYPEHSSYAPAVSSLARTYLNLGEYDLGIALVQESRKKKSIYDSRSFAYLGEQLWKLFEAKGDLQGMLQTVQAHRTLYSLRLKNQDLDSFLKEDMERYLMFNGFRRGYVLFALGDLQAAAAAFEDHIKDMTAMEAELLKRQKGLPPYGDIYRKRSMDCLRFVTELAGQPAPRDFDLEGLWVTPREASLARLAGKVTALVFRNVGDGRSAPFVESVSALCASHPDLEMVTISYLKGAGNVVRLMDEMRRELESLGYEGAAGLDPDADNKGLFRAYMANVGSASFIVIDRRGLLRWFQQDPRSVDVNLANGILQRALSEN